MQSIEALSLPVDQVDSLLLVREITHRVVNEYSHAIAGIRLAEREAVSAEARAVLSAAAKRLLTYAEAHRALQPPHGQGTADLADYLSRLCATMSAARLEERGARLTLTSDSIALAVERCWRIGLIVSELITNSVRHGLKDGSGHIRVEMEAGRYTSICRVIDDGDGSAICRPGQGLGVIAGLVSEIGGAISWRFAPSGTLAELIFPNVFPGEVACHSLIEGC
jgi:two-component sensor histidine kinase